MSWKAAMLGEARRPESKYARMGTAVHWAIESFLRRDFDLDTPSAGPFWTGVIAAGVPDKECKALVTYLESISAYRDQIVSLESEFTLGVVPNAWPLRGHIDALIWSPDGTMIVLDHKTNRQYEGAETWSKKVQQIAYAWAVRKMFPTVERVAFEIGYVNQGTKVTWLTNPSDDDWLTNTFAAAWQDFQVYTRHSEWPARLNSNCGWCPLQVDCPVFSSSMEKLLPSPANTSLPGLSGKSPLENVIFLEKAMKAGQSLLDSLKQQLVELATSSGGEYTESGNVVRLTYSSRRKADEKVAWSTLMEILNDHPEVDADWQELVGDVLTFKVTGVDKLVKRAEQFRPLIDRAIAKVTSDEPSVKIIPAGGPAER